MGSLLPGTGALVFALGIVRSPDEAVRASLAGLDLWWNVVFPGLLPPLVLAELLAAFGALRALGILLEPVAGPLFRLPGAAGWAVAVGWAGGIPAGARETARLLEKGLIGRREAETALLVAHMPNLFLVVLIVGAGFLHSPRLGWTMAGGLWLSAVLAGWLWSRFAGDRGRHGAAAAAQGRRSPPPADGGTPLWRRVWRAVREAREADGRPPGKVLADGVADSVLLLFAVGGLMIMSSVAISLVRQTLPGTDAWALVPGVVDMHLGAYENSRSPLLAASPERLAALMAALLAWSGFSGLLQARAAYGTAAPFPWVAFLAGRLLHAALAFLCTYPLASRLAGSDPAVPHSAWQTAAAAGPREAGSGWLLAGETALALLGCLAAFALLALLAALIRPKPPSAPVNADGGQRPASGGRPDRADG